MRLAPLLVIALLAPGWMLRAEERAAGDFDHYLMALSWSPSWCEAEGDARSSPQCGEERDHGFILHGLWPQHEDGWPAHCRTTRRDPSRAETAAMADIMGTGGLAWHQWRKHGRCTGLSAGDYFALSREAYRRVVRPEVFRKLDKAVRVDASVIEAAFLEANPDLTPDGVTVICRDGRIREVRICLSRDLTPRPCAPDAARDCRGAARMPPIR